MRGLRALVAVVGSAVLGASSLTACTPKRPVMVQAIMVTETRDPIAAQRVGEVPTYLLVNQGRGYRAQIDAKQVDAIEEFELGRPTVDKLLDRAEQLGLLDQSSTPAGQPTPGQLTVRLQRGSAKVELRVSNPDQPADERERAVQTLMDEIDAAFDGSTGKPVQPKQWLIMATRSADRTATGAPWNNRFDLDELTKCRPISTESTPLEKQPYEGSGLFGDGEPYNVIWVVQLDSMTCPGH